jgi:hypothetical protein
MKGELLVAIYGALTGTIAILVQVRQWRLDRAILKVEGAISIVNTDKIRVLLSISVVNNGRRPVNIRRVGALLAKESVSIPLGLSPQRKAEELKKLQDMWQYSELTLFGGRDEKPIYLDPDGGHHVWKSAISKGLKFLSESKGNEQVGKAFVELTSGKKVFCTFLLLNDDQWPPYGVTQGQPASKSAV